MLLLVYLHCTTDLPGQYCNQPTFPSPSTTSCMSWEPRPGFGKWSEWRPSPTGDVSWPARYDASLKDNQHPSKEKILGAIHSSNRNAGHVGCCWSSGLGIGLRKTSQSALLEPLTNKGVSIEVPLVPDRDVKENNGSPHTSKERGEKIASGPPMMAMRPAVPRR